MRILLLTILLGWITSTLQAQDLHYTLAHLAPMHINAAQTGGFSGTYRASVIYRDQNRSAFGTSYSSPILSVDSPFMWGFKKNHWVGGGITLWADRNVGVGNYNQSGMHMSLAYHIGLNKSLTSSIAIGARYGLVSRSVSGDYKYADEIISAAMSSSDDGLTANFEDGYSPIDVGLTWNQQLGKRSKVKLGIGSYQLTDANFMYDSTNVLNTIETRWIGHLVLTAGLTDNFALIPTFYYQTQGPSTNFVAQINTAINLRPTRKGQDPRPFMVYPGLGMRMGDAIQFLLGMDIKGYHLALAYDYSINDYSGITKSAAFEIGLQKVFTVFKKPEVKPVIFCPRM